MNLSDLPPLAPAGAPPAAARAEAGLTLLAELLAAPDLVQAAQALAAGLGRLSQAAGSTHVWVGWVPPDAPGGGTRLLASWSAAGQAAGAGAEAVQAALDEALDQIGLLREGPAAVSWAADTAGEPGEALTWALQELVRLQAASGCATAWGGCLPLVRPAEGEAPPEVWGAVCLCGTAQPDGPATLDTLGPLCALATPVLALQATRRPGWRDLWRRHRQDLAARWRDPAAGRFRLGLRVALGALAVATLLPVDRQVGGLARVEGAEQRVLAAPADGFLQAVHARPGDRVRAGQVLVDLAEQDWRLERDKWASQLAQHESAYAAAMARSDRSEAAGALARIDEAQAQLALVSGHLQRAQLAAPMDGVVIEGDLSQRIGAPVRQGDVLLTVAAGGRFRVVVEVDEHAIAGLQPGQAGHLRLAAWFGPSWPIRVQRITPLARVTEAGNVYEVHADLPAPADSALPALRPGLQGQAQIVVGRSPWLWNQLRPLGLRLRLAWWAWAGR